MRTLILFAACAVFVACGDKDTTDTAPATDDTAPAETASPEDTSPPEETGEPCDESTWYRDLDGDGYGNPERSLQACEAPAGYITDSSDCDDDDAEHYPGAEEDCDASDGDCDGTVDEGFPTDTWYADADGDGYGDADAPIEHCEQPSGAVDDGTKTGWDCDDEDDDAYPGAEEICGDGADQDCDGADDACPDTGGSDPGDPDTGEPDPDKEDTGG